MTLLCLTLIYFAGIVIGHLLWNSGWIGCDFPKWLWILPLAVTPLTPLLNRLEIFKSQSSIPQQWPTSAGFQMPRSGPSPALVFACLLCLLTGAFRYASQPTTPCWTSMDLAHYNLPAERAFDREAPQVTIIGYINSYPLVSDTKQRLHVIAESITTDDGTYQVHGTLRLNIGIRMRYRYGQPVRLRGRLVTPFEVEEFSYRNYLARKGIHSLFYNAKIDLLPEPAKGNWLKHGLFAFRARGESLLNRLLPEPYAALANGMLLGIEAGIPDVLYEQFNLTGTSHTIVISGSNISLLAGVLLAVGQRVFGETRAIWPTLIGIGCYALLVGGDPAVLRAALMGGLYVIATHLGRRSTAIVSLAVACWAMTLLNPLTLWDVGFQLSSGATAGLILFSPSIAAAVQRFWPSWQGGYLTASDPQVSFHSIQRMFYGLLQDGLLVTIAANITTLPIVVYHFGRLSVVSFLTNLLIAPVQSFIMLGGSAGILIGVVGSMVMDWVPLIGYVAIVLTWIAWLILLIPWLSLVWTVAMIQWTAALPGASLEIVGYDFMGLILTYVVIFGIHWRAQLRQWGEGVLESGITNWQSRILGPGAVGALGIGSILIWATVLSQPDGRLHVYFLDVGQGDGIFIQTSSGRQVLIDGGESPQTLFSELGAVMPFWDRSIDLLILSHPDADHANAQAEVPKRFDIAQALDTAVSQSNTDGVAWRASMSAANVEVQFQHTGGWIDLGDGAALWVIWPPPEGYVGEDESLD